MKKLLFASTLLCGLHGHALAADAVVDEVLVVAEGYNWSGVYIGAQVGYAWANADVDYAVEPDGQYAWDIDPDGVLGGIYAGANWQMSNGFVVGAETEININDGSDRAVFIDNYVPTFPGYYDMEARLDWSGSTRIRLGYAMDRWMGFVTGGIAYAGYEINLHDEANGEGNLPRLDDRRWRRICGHRQLARAAVLSLYRL